MAGVSDILKLFLQVPKRGKVANRGLGVVQGSKRPPSPVKPGEITQQQLDDLPKIAEALGKQRSDQHKLDLAKHTIAKVKRTGFDAEDFSTIQFRLNFRDAGPVLRKKMRDEVDRAGLSGSQLIPKELK